MGKEIRANGGGNIVGTNEDDLIYDIHAPKGEEATVTGKGGSDVFSSPIWSEKYRIPEGKITITDMNPCENDQFQLWISEGLETLPEIVKNQQPGSLIDEELHSAIFAMSDYDINLEGVHHSELEARLSVHIREPNQTIRAWSIDFSFKENACSNRENESTLQMSEASPTDLLPSPQTPISEIGRDESKGIG